MESWHLNPGIDSRVQALITVNYCYIISHNVRALSSVFAEIRPHLINVGRCYEVSNQIITVYHASFISEVFLLFPLVFNAPRKYFLETSTNPHLFS